MDYFIKEICFQIGVINYWTGEVNIMFVYLMIFFMIVIPLSFLIMILHLLYSMVFTGENSRSAVLSAKKFDSENWEIENSTFVALLGTVNVKLNKSELENFEKSKLKIETTAIFGSVNFVLPEEASFIIENKTFCGRIKAKDAGSEKGLYFEENFNHKTDNNFPGILFNSISIFGFINLK